MRSSDREPVEHELSDGTPVARVAFAALVCATLGAFFVAQELKTTPPLVQDLTRQSPYFSPNRDGRLDRGRISFRLKHGDEVTATVINADSEAIRTIVSGRRLLAQQRMRLVWDGTNASNAPAPDGIYRIRLSLRLQNRTIVLPRNLQKDTKPPKIRITAIGPVNKPGAEVLPTASGEPVTVHFQAPPHHRALQVLRTDTRTLRPVFDTPIRLADHATRWKWHGTVHRHRVPAGTYLVVLSARDRAGNVGSSIDVPRRFTRERFMPDHAGIIVR